jgi:hypothetical protein
MTVKRNVTSFALKAIGVKRTRLNMIAEASAASIVDDATSAAGNLSPFAIVLDAEISRIQ